MAKTKYWNINNILSKFCQYNMVIGERSNGKTYGTIKYGLEEFFKHGSEIAIIRRMEEDFRGKRASTLFAPFIDNKVIEKLSKGKYNSVKYYSQRWYLQHIEEKKENCYVDDEPFAYAFALTSMEHDKSSSYPRIRTVIFDEFLTRNVYLNDEFVTFQNVLSTIIRDRNDVIIFMLGNTVNKYCPYFKEMGLNNVSTQEPQTIDIYTYGDSGLRVAVEFCGRKTDKDDSTPKKKSDVYFAFNNPKLQMIKSGTWEIDIYPHLPCKYLPKDIRYMYFIKFNDEILQCEIIRVTEPETKRKVMFTYIHRKTTDIRDDNGKYIVYQEEFSPLSNYKRRITKPKTELEKFILSFFSMDKVFYQDNDVGEVVRNYLQWSM